MSEVTSQRKFSCPACGHFFHRGHEKGFVSWRFTRRSAMCPDCGTALELEQKAFLRIAIGFWLFIVSSGILSGIILAPWLQGVLGQSQPVSLLDAFANTPVTVAAIAALVLEVVSFAVLFSGLLKIHLVRISAQPSIDGHA